MKAIILSLASGILLIIFATMLFRVWHVERRARALFQIFLLCLGLLVMMHLLTPANLGILPPSTVIPMPFVDLVFAVFLLTVGFMGGVLQVYNLADRGLSLRMIIDILTSPCGKATSRDVMTQYSGGQGIEWMYEKRFQGLLAAGLIKFDDSVVRLTQKGRRVANLFATLQNYCGIMDGKGEL
jgi:hypothetical protein